MQYKHYSFDLWQTLIKPNPEFKEKRLDYFSEYFLGRGKSMWCSKIDNIFVDVWMYFDQYSQLFGEAPNPLEMYAMVIFRATGSLKGLSPLDMELMYADMEKLFLKHPPTLYDDDTKAVLEELKIRGKTLSILSNTSYTRGRTLEKVLHALGIKDLFQFRLYSDELRYSKPSHRVFTKVWECVNIPIDDGMVGVEEIIHIGDNPIADGAGAQEYGFGHLVINSNHLTIKDLL